MGYFNDLLFADIGTDYSHNDEVSIVSVSHKKTTKRIGIILIALAAMIFRTATSTRKKEKKKKRRKKKEKKKNRKISENIQIERVCHVEYCICTLHCITALPLGKQNTLRLVASLFNDNNAVKDDNLVNDNNAVIISVYICIYI